MLTGLVMASRVLLALAQILQKLLTTALRRQCQCSWPAMSWTFLDLPPVAVRSAVAMLFISFVIYALVLFQPGQVNALRVTMCTPVAEPAWHRKPPVLQQRCFPTLSAMAGHPCALKLPQDHLSSEAGEDCT